MRQQVSIKSTLPVISGFLRPLRFDFVGQDVDQPVQNGIHLVFDVLLALVFVQCADEDAISFDAALDRFDKVGVGFDFGIFRFLQNSQLFWSKGCGNRETDPKCLDGLSDIRLIVVFTFLIVESVAIGAANVVDSQIGSRRGLLLRSAKIHV